MIASVHLNRTTFDLGHSAAFLLKISYSNQSRRKWSTLAFMFVAASLVALVVVATLVCVLRPWKTKNESPSPTCDSIEANGISLERNSDKEESNSVAVPTTATTQPSTGSLLNLSLAVGLMMVVGCACSNSCNDFPVVRVILHLPKKNSLVSINVFLKRSFTNSIIKDNWSQENKTKLILYDIDSPGVPQKALCDSNSSCLVIPSQHLLGCDVETRKCICHRGYELVNDSCTDIDECADEKQPACPGFATCENTLGNFKCHCGYGFYGNSQTCRPCSGSCPEGFFKQSSCTINKDRVCKECTKCLPSNYEVRRCTESSDRICLHVAHPLLIGSKKMTKKFLADMSERRLEIRKKKKVPTATLR